jgi:F-type H+-transporting ATPase subunit gamma
VELQRVKKRIATTGQIRQVTSAMQRVASARLLNDRSAMDASRRYTERLRALMADLFDAAPWTEHPLLLPGRPDRPVVLVVFGAERGLCGGFNTNLANRMAAFAAEAAPRPVRIVAVGKVAARRARRAGLEIVEALPQPPRRRHAETIDRVTDRVTSLFLDGRASEVHVLYSRFVSGLVQQPVTERVLPAAFGDGRRGGLRAAIFEPDAEGILNRLIPEFVRQLMDHGFLHSVASENAARQVAMSRATENAAQMLGNLMGDYRRLRQESITTEMLEIMGGRTGRRT